MLKKRHSLRVALSAAFLALLMLLTVQVISSPTTHAGTSAKSASKAQSAEAQSRKAQKARVKARNRRLLLRDCKNVKSRKFNERQAGFSKRVKVATRCALATVPGIKTVGTRSGHNPTASRALDFMVNTKGNCKAGRAAGNEPARYFMEQKRNHGVLYVIWRNGYWSANSRPMAIKDYRKMGRGGCTQGHYDHVHVAFK